MFDITASVVTYRNDIKIVQKTIDSFLNTDLNVMLYVVDNSPSDEISRACKSDKIKYVFNGKNLGFGAGHNMAMRQTVKKSKYHLILNPDIFFERGTLEGLYDFMERDDTIGLVMPKILCFDGKIQHLCRLLPTPFSLILRRLNIDLLNDLFKTAKDNHMLGFTNYARIMEVPCLSGCFMFTRSSALTKVGFFDERFFMYMEDFDLSRRMYKHFQTLFYPGAVAYHGHARGSYEKFSLFMRHILSSIKYFNKWGWFFDKERVRINLETIDKAKISYMKRVQFRQTKITSESVLSLREKLKY